MTSAPGFEELVYNQGYFKAFLYFWFLVFIPRYTKPYPVHCYFHPNGLGRWVASMYNRFNTSTLPYTFHQYYIYIFFGGNFIQNVNEMVWTCPWYEEDCVFKGLGWRVTAGRRRPGNCATDYNDKSSQKNYETNIYTNHMVYNTKAFWNTRHPRVRFIGRHINS